MACCGNRDGTPRQSRVTVNVVVAPDGEVESVWPAWREARVRATQLGTGYRPEQRKMNLADGTVGGKRINRSCCGH